MITCVNFIVWGIFVAV